MLIMWQLCSMLTCMHSYSLQMKKLKDLGRAYSKWPRSELGGLAPKTIQQSPHYPQFQLPSVNRHPEADDPPVAVWSEGQW